MTVQSPADGAVEPKRSQKRWLIPKLILTALITWLILRGVGVRLAVLSEIDRTLLRPRASWLAFSVAALGTAFVVTARLWAAILVGLSGPRIPTRAAVSIVLLSNLGRYIPGKVFQLAGLAFLTKQRGVSPLIAGAAAVMGQVLHLLGAALVGGWTVFELLDLPVLWGVASGAVIFVGFLAVIRAGGLSSLLGWALQLRGHQRTEVPSLENKTLVGWLTLYTANWLLLGAAFYGLARGMGLEISIVTATTGFAGAYLLGYLALFAPAGIGIREGLLVVFLTPALGTPAAVALAGGQRVWITVVEAIGAAAGWAWLDRARRSAGQRTREGLAAHDSGGGVLEAPDGGAESSPSRPASLEAP